MKAVAADNAPDGDVWVHELKWDGMRAIMHLRSGLTRVQSGNGRDVSVSFPEIAPIAQLARELDGLVLDGELVAFREGLPSFGALQQRMHVANEQEAQRRARVTPVMFVAFDVLHVGGDDTMRLPLKDRHRLLNQIVEPGPSWRVSDQHGGDEGAQALLDVVNANSLEGIVSKRSDAAYVPGKRSASWVKVKPRQREEFVVGGWISGQGNRANEIGSLLLGWYDSDSTLRYAGRAGSGLDATSLADWRATLKAASTSPFADTVDVPRDRTVHWVQPDHVAEIAYGEWPAGGHLRHPAVLGRRADKAAADVRREG